jgi:16S rRNA (guanine527-N7)-methyltransferase
VVAASWPEAELVLLDAGTRRTAFLRRAVAECEFGDRVTVVHQRAELFGREVGARHSFDGVLVRSFGPPAVVAECAAPLLKKQGSVVVSEPPESEGWGEAPEGRWPASGLRECGLEAAEYLRGAFGYQVLRQVELCPEKFPRRDGVPAKKPLF